MPDTAAQAWALIKITSPEFHLTFHDRKADKRIALMMLPQAQAQARTLETKLLTEQGLVATSSRDDYWHAAYRDLVDANDYRNLATHALRTLETLPPETPADRALADEEYTKAAGALFRQTLMPTWDDRLGAFATAGRTAYTPETTATMVAALNAMRWHGPADLAEEAARRYPRFLETVLVRGGLLLSSPLPLVPAEYRDNHPEGAFAHPELPAPVETGVAPVFAGGIVRGDGTWRVSDRRFHTAAALFLANMLVMSHEDRADPFLPAERLADLRR